MQQEVKRNLIIFSIAFILVLINISRYSISYKGNSELIADIPVAAILGFIAVYIDHYFKSKIIFDILAIFAVVMLSFLWVSISNFGY